MLISIARNRIELQDSWTYTDGGLITSAELFVDLKQDKLLVYI